MNQYTKDTKKKIKELAKQNGLSEDAVTHLLHTLIQNNVSMSQFNHPELGGMGQWMQSGMIMIGDMFNNNLKAKIGNVCIELSQYVQHNKVTKTPKEDKKGKKNKKMTASTDWWASLYQHPAMVGGQNDMAYAVFPQEKRLLIKDEKKVKVYDTLNYRIGGVSQQQGSIRTVKFGTQSGEVAADDLPLLKTVKL